MHHSFVLVSIVTFLGVTSLSTARAQAPSTDTLLALGTHAPNFTLSAVDGPPISLSSQNGKFVVLKWVDPACPFVQYSQHGGWDTEDFSCRVGARSGLARHQQRWPWTARGRP